MAHDEFKILIVDDDRSSLDVLSGILQPDYKIAVAKSGKQALERAMADKPDLILLDIIMPGMNGFEVLSALKEMDDTRSIPVIIITGLDTVVDEEKGFRLGAVDYITKPFNKSLVKARVVTHLRIVEQVRIIEQFGLLDPLTNIPNRRSLNTQMALEWRRAIGGKTPVSFGMVDLDHFKMVNDTYGHQQGDVVLKSVAGILKSSMRRPSDFAARWGGEEFAVLLPETDSNGALKLAEDIRGNIEKALIPGIADTSTISVTASIGIALTVPTVESSMSDLIERADQALYAAKKAGRNRVCLL